MTDTERLDKLEAMQRRLGRLGYFIGEVGQVLAVTEFSPSDTKVYRTLRQAIDAAPEPDPARLRRLPARFKRAAAAAEKRNAKCAT